MRIFAVLSPTQTVHVVLQLRCSRITKFEPTSFSPLFVFVLQFFCGILLPANSSILQCVALHSNKLLFLDPAKGCSESAKNTWRETKCSRIVWPTLGLAGIMSSCIGFFTSGSASRFGIQSAPELVCTTVFVPT